MNIEWCTYNIIAEVKRPAVFLNKHTEITTHTYGASADMSDIHNKAIVWWLILFKIRAL